jgi:hypothetical protein
MPIEQEEQELKLTVTLDDRAAMQQLARLQQSLRDVATHAGDQGAAQHMKRFSESLRNPSKDATEIREILSRFGVRAPSIANSFRGIGGAVAIVSIAVAKLIEESDKFSRAMVRRPIVRIRITQQ